MPLYGRGLAFEDSCSCVLMNSMGHTAIVSIAPATHPAASGIHAGALVSAFDINGNEYVGNVENARVREEGVEGKGGGRGGGGGEREREREIEENKVEQREDGRWREWEEDKMDLKWIQIHSNTTCRLRLELLVSSNYSSELTI